MPRTWLRIVLYFRDEGWIHTNGCRRIASLQNQGQ
jgi:hypothetical protein